MKTNKMLGIICSLLFVIIIVGGVISFKQYGEIQECKIANLNTAFYYMQEIIEDGEKDNFADWDKKASNLYIMIERADVSEEDMGDYQEVCAFIQNVSRLEDPAEAQSAALIAQAKNMRVSWCTENGKWSVTIEK